MKNDKMKQLIPVILIAVVTLIALFAIWLLGRAIFSGGNKQDTKSEISQAREALLSTDLSRGVMMTVRGPITADETFKTFLIYISPEERYMTAYEGYRGTVIDSKNYPNNTVAYEEFVYALNKAQMIDSKPLTSDSDDTRGVCARGKLTEFDLLTNGSSHYHLWTSTCKGSPGSLKASSQQLRDLFVKQIPDASKLFKEAKINF